MATQHNNCICDQCWYETRFVYLGRERMTHIFIMEGPAAASSRCVQVWSVVSGMPNIFNPMPGECAVIYKPSTQDAEIYGERITPDMRDAGVADLRATVGRTFDTSVVRFATGLRATCDRGRRMTFTGHGVVVHN